MNTFQKLLGISFLIIALSVCYYFVIFIPQKENAKIKLQEQEKEDKKLKEEEIKNTLNICLNDADTSYSDFWNKECKSQGLLSQLCIDFLNMSLGDYIKQKNIPANDINKDSKVRIEVINEYFKKKEDCSCLLPKYNADRVEQYKKDLKDECFKKYPTN